MRVLITRPEFQALKTAEKLQELGHDPVVFPLFKPTHDLAIALEALKSPHAAILLTSAEAIRCLRRLGPVLDPYLSEPVFTVGKVTAQAARDAGFTEVYASSGGGLELAAMVAGFFAARGLPVEPMLYLTGVKRSPDLEEALGALGIACAVAEIYAMLPIAYSLDEQQTWLVNRPVDAVFFYSRENARTFFALDVFQTSRDALKKTLFFCLSRNIAHAVPAEFKHSVVVSQNPDEDELIDLL
jgi:uroporphyrinogen-III synthase